jgi:hypothetical protein
MAILRVRYASGVALPALAELPRGALVAKCELVDAAYTDVNGHRRPGKYPVSARGEKPGRCKLCNGWLHVAGPCPNADPWATRGELGLVLANVKVFKEPIPHRGQLGFFDVPDDVIAKAEVLV